MTCRPRRRATGSSICAASKASPRSHNRS
jgi:hypothetical protein